MKRKPLAEIEGFSIWARMKGDSAMVVGHDDRMLSMKARIALEISVRGGLQRTIEASCDMAENLLDEFERRGWVAKIPDYREVEILAEEEAAYRRMREIGFEAIVQDRIRNDDYSEGGDDEGGDAEPEQK